MDKPAGWKEYYSCGYHTVCIVWFELFRGGNLDVKDLLRSGRLLTHFSRD